ncbi:MAG: hypothetical protein OHM56_01545 [Spiroplasma phoeniceum]|nr:MAG: hypothetical protein OHM57_00980 [Spiroplasma phoeniceum]UZQ32673.1 MAG: hypothetical protein OHM56_01545 [Spiroplasma phoeniceum]
MLSNYTYSKYAINKGYNDDVKLFSPYYFELVSNPWKEETGYWVFENCKVELNSLYFNFSGSAPIPPEPVNYWEEVYANDKPFNKVDNRHYFVISRVNKDDDWHISKFENNIPLSDNEKRTVDSWNGRVLNLKNKGFGKVNLQLIGDGWVYWWKTTDDYFKSVYRWNSVGEPNKPFIDTKTGKITDWNLKQQTKINNNKENEIKVTVKNKDISENLIYQLEANYFNWLSITSELETNNIPSLIPA